MGIALVEEFTKKRSKRGREAEGGMQRDRNLKKENMLP